jgi:glycolate oxidase FAD binding subunit
VTAAVFERLAAALGEGALGPAPACAPLGVQPAAALEPADAEGLARAVAALGALGLAALVRGAGTHSGVGNLPSRADVLLSTRRLAGILELDSGEGVCRVRAGTPLSELRAAANARGWELPLDAPGRGSTVGGVLAAAALGPRAQGYGLPRDLVLGLDVVLGDGTLTRCGGRVVKNVTGYDLAKLYTGSLGTLGVIAAAWLRLRPRPERVRAFEADPADADTAGALGLEAARRPTARAAAVALAPGSTPRLVVELAGDAPAVESDAAWLARHLRAREAGPEALDALRRVQADAPGADGLRFRLALRPSRLAGAASALAQAGAGVLLYPGLGLAFALFARAEGDAARRAFDAVASLAREAGGSWVLEAGPPAARAARDAFGEAAALLPLTRALKQRFDPAGVLNPGRQLGGT